MNERARGKVSERRTLSASPEKVPTPKVPIAEK